MISVPVSDMIFTSNWAYYNFYLFWVYASGLLQFLMCFCLGPVLGWEWGLLSYQEVYTAEETYECLLWPTISGIELDCFLVWWASTSSRADSWRGISLILSLFSALLCTYVPWFRGSISIFLIFLVLSQIVRTMMGLMGILTFYVPIFL